MATPAYGRPDGNAELREYSRLVAATFGADPETIHSWIATLGSANVRLLRAGRELAGGLSLYPMGQFFGGCSVPCWGLAGVVLPPHQRGRGTGRQMLVSNLREQFEQGPPLAALFPASTHVYRDLGYEQAGLRVTARIRPLELPRLRAELDVRPIGAADWPELRRLYQQARGQDNGCLDRSPEIWERLRRVPQGTLLQGHVFERKGKAEGYLVFTLARKEGALRLNMTLRDWAFVTPAARQTLLHQLWVQRSVVEDITLQMGPNDPLLHGIVHDQNARVIETMAWMLRIVRVQEALTARGWPRISATAEFAVVDEQLKENSGPWRLSVTKGKAQVAKGKSSRTRLHTRGLAALYSGFMAPDALRRAGLLQGDDRHDAALAALFASPMPYVLDYF